MTVPGNIHHSNCGRGVGQRQTDREMEIGIPGDRHRTKCKQLFKGVKVVTPVVSIIRTSTYLARESGQSPL